MFMVGSGNFVYFCKNDVSAVQGHPMSLNRKHICDFLLVRNLGPILHRLGDFAAYVFLIPPLFHPNFGGVPVAPDRPRWG